MATTEPLDLPALQAAAAALEKLLGPRATDLVRCAMEQAADQVGVATPGELRALGLGLLIASQMDPDAGVPPKVVQLVGGCVLVRSAQGR